MIPFASCVNVYPCARVCVFSSTITEMNACLLSHSHIKTFV